MKTIKSLTMRLSVLGLLLCGITSQLFAQGDPASRPSPAATASGKVGDANVTIQYSSPSVKGRTVWGELVPYGKPWRAGANEATVFETDQALNVEGQTLPAGKYSLFAVPGENEWSIIFNSETGQWGSKRSGEANFDPAKNVVTATVKPQQSPTMNERLVYEINDSGFVLKWENVEVPVSLSAAD